MLCANGYRAAAPQTSSCCVERRVRSNSWSGRHATAQHVCSPEDSAVAQLRSDTKCYGGRFTYGQWRQFFKARRGPRREKGTQLDAAGQVIKAGAARDFSWNGFIQYFRGEIWLLVLLHSDAATMGSLGSCCQGFRQISMPWRHGGTAASAETRTEMPVVHLAARLRCGVPLAEDLLRLRHEIQLPAGRCRSWLQMLYGQESKGTWLCLVSSKDRSEVAEDFPRALRKAEDWREDGRGPITVALLPSAQMHVNSGHRVTVRRDIKILGLPLPFLTGPADIQLCSRWQAPAEHAGTAHLTPWKEYLPTLSLQNLEIALDVEGCVEMQNLVLFGHGTSEATPSGISDCCLRVAKGTCLVADCQFRIKEGQAGFGVVVGPDPSVISDGLTKPHLMLRRTEVVHASTACLCFMGGQLSVEDGCILRNCKVGICVCDQGSNAFILGTIRILCLQGGRKFEEVAGGIVTRPRSTFHRAATHHTMLDH
eukprot:gb/GFBE01023646.1/.p1 GENE.gb/GFBE01023646.1/~~gb/GFBE01023646.1/.p1  ORF type:complete len:481 (+),score=51.06 gb/GFBE01023646.1/:1-1443(+)